MRGWPVWQLPRWLAACIIAVITAYVAVAAGALASTPVRPGDLRLCAVFVGCGAASVELTRRAGARLLRLERRVPYAAAMNASIAGSHGDLVAFLQADTFVAPGYLEAACAPFADPLVGSVAPKLVRALGPRPEDRLEELDAADRKSVV